MDLKLYVVKLMENHIPYKKNPPYSVEQGFNCFSWMVFLHNQYVDHQCIPDTTTELRNMLKHHQKVRISPQYLDIPLFYFESIGSRHVGLMLDDHMMTQCSETTNGVSIVDITKTPWSNLLRHLYRHK